MNVVRFISSKIKFSGKIAVISVSVSFFVIIIAIAISAGFRNEIRNGVSDLMGDVFLSPVSNDFLSGSYPLPEKMSYNDEILSIKGVKSITPVVYRAGILREGDIYGLVFKGVDNNSSKKKEPFVKIPKSIAKKTGYKIGDRMTVYFIGEKVRVRKFEIDSIYDDVLGGNDKTLAFVDIDELRRINGWKNNEVSAFEIGLEPEYRNVLQMEEIASEIGNVAYLNLKEDEPALFSSSAVRRFPQLFDWLELIDFNVFIILGLMILVAGFNMISGSLIMLFRNISTIGTLKTLGMRNGSIARVFLRSASILVLKGLVIGNALALSFCILQSCTHCIKLNPENYFVSYVPIHINIGLIVIIDIIAYLIIMILLLLPSIFVSKIDPAKTAMTQ